MSRSGRSRPEPVRRTWPSTSTAASSPAAATARSGAGPTPPAASASRSAFAHTGGRPLGIEIDPRDGSLVVCDAYRGLLRVRGDGSVVTLADIGGGRADPVREQRRRRARRRRLLQRELHALRLRRVATRRGRRRAARPPAALRPGRRRGHRGRGRPLLPERRGADPGRRRPCSWWRPRRGGCCGSPRPAASRTVLASLPAYPDNMSPVGDGTYWIALPTSRGPRTSPPATDAPTQQIPLDTALVVLVDGTGGCRADDVRASRPLPHDHRGPPRRRHPVARQPDRAGCSPRLSTTHRHGSPGTARVTLGDAGGPSSIRCRGLVTAYVGETPPRNC